MATATIVFFLVVIASQYPATLDSSKEIAGFSSEFAVLWLKCFEVQEDNIRKTMATLGLVRGRDPRSGRDLVFRCYPPELPTTIVYTLG